MDLLFANVKSLLGIEIPPVEIKDILTRLGFVIDKEDQDGLTVGVPTYRFDISLRQILSRNLFVFMVTIMCRRHQDFFTDTNHKRTRENGSMTEYEIHWSILVIKKS